MATPSEILTQDIDPTIDLNIFHIMQNRRSQRAFIDREVEWWKVALILAAADTAPTAGGFQGFEIYKVNDKKKKEELVSASNNQPWVNAPLVLIFCMNPGRVKMSFPEHILKKFSLQDATLAAAYAQLAAHAIGLSSIWIGMFDEERVMNIIGTDLIPSSILCIGYPKKTLMPKPKRNINDLVHEI